MFHRSAVLEVDAEAVETGGDSLRRFETQFSSETPVLRTITLRDGSTVEGLEVLSHDPAHVDMGFLASGRAPLLADHDTTRQIGVIEAAEISNRVGRASGKFSRATSAHDIVTDVLDGVRRNVSVGYYVTRFRLEPQSSGPPILRALAWTPYEVSVLSVPADMEHATIVARAGEREISTKVETMEDDDIQVQETSNRAAATAVADRPGTEQDAERIREEARKGERSRVKAIRALGERHNRSDLAEEAVDKGTSLELFRGIMLDVIGESKPLETPASTLGMSRKEVARYSFRRILNFLASEQPSRAERERAAFELECNQEVAKKETRDPRGVFVPTEILERGFAPDEVAGLAKRNPDYMNQISGGRMAPSYAGARTMSIGAGTGGQLVGTDHLGGSFIEVLYNAMRVRSLGARILSGLRGNVQIPRRTAGGGTRWVAELTASVSGADLNVGDSTFDQVTLTPRDLTTTSAMSRRLLLQSDPSIEMLIRADLATQIALAVDSAAINGDNTADVNQPDGIFNASGTQNTSFGPTTGGPITYALAVEMVRKVLAANAIGLGNLGWLMNANGWARGMTVTRDSGSGQFLLRDGRFVEYPWELSEQVPDNLVEGASGAVLNGIIFAAWNAMLIGEWGTLELQVDPYTLVATGAIRVNAFMTTDIAFRYPQAFSYSVDMQ